MYRLNLLALVLLLPWTAAIPACGQLPSASAPSDTQPTTAPNTESATNDQAAVKVLQSLEQAGKKYPTLRADIDYRVEMLELGDSERRTGWVAYQRDLQADDEKIRIHFDTLQQGDGPNRREKLDYTFDGQWAAEAKHSIKQLTRYQVAPPGEKVRALEIGKGPFPPLPFGQKADEVLKFYRVSTLPAGQSDPKDADGLLLVARRERQKDLNFTRLEMWVERQRGLPLKITGYEKDKNVHTVLLTNLQAGEKLPSDILELKKGFGWTEETRPYQE